MSGRLVPLPDEAKLSASVKVRPDEAALINEMGRCIVCGHLEVLHYAYNGDGEPVACRVVPDMKCVCNPGVMHGNRRTTD